MVETRKQHRNVIIIMASKNRTFNVKHMGGAVDRKESERVTKDYEVRFDETIDFFDFGCVM